MKRTQDVYSYYNDGVDKILDAFKPCGEYKRGIREEKALLKQDLEQYRLEKDRQIEVNQAEIVKVDEEISALSGSGFYNAELEREMQAIRSQQKSREDNERGLRQKIAELEQPYPSVEEQCKKFETEQYETYETQYLSQHAKYFKYEECRKTHAAALCGETSKWLENRIAPCKKYLDEASARNIVVASWETSGENCFQRNNGLIALCIKHFSSEIQRLDGHIEEMASEYASQKTKSSFVLSNLVKWVLVIVVALWLLFAAPVLFFIVAAVIIVYNVKKKGIDKVKSQVKDLFSDIKRQKDSALNYQNYLEEGRKLYEETLSVSRGIVSDLTKVQSEYQQQWEIAQSEADRRAKDELNRQVEMRQGYVRDFKEREWPALLHRQEERYRQEERDRAERLSQCRQQIAQLEEEDVREAEHFEQLQCRMEEERQQMANDKERLIQEKQGQKSMLLQDRDRIDADYNIRVQKREEESKTKIEEFEKSYTEKKQELVKKMDEENGMEDICGFNYRKAWARLFALATETHGLPYNYEFYEEDSRRPEADTLVNLIAGASDEKKLDKGKLGILPIHTIRGYERCEMDEDLMKDSELWESMFMSAQAGQEGYGGDYKSDTWKKGEKAEFHIKPLPWDGFYKLQLEETMHHQVIYVYDFGDINTDENKKKRTALRDFIIRTCVYGPFRNINNRKYFNCDIVISESEGDYRNFAWGGDDNYMIQFSSDTRENIKRLEEICTAAELMDGTVYETNLKRAKRGMPPKAPYQMLVIYNVTFSDYKNSKLVNIVEQAGSREENSCSVYPCIFIDKHKLAGGKDGGPDRASAEYCLELTRKFNGAIYELQELNDTDETAMFGFRKMERKHLEEDLAKWAER